MRRFAATLFLASYAACFLYPARKRCLEWLFVAEAVRAVIDEILARPEHAWKQGAIYQK